MLPFDFQPSYLSLWSRFNEAYQRQRLPQALLVQSRELKATALLEHMSMMMLCQSDTAPCGECQSCFLIQEESHPDWEKVSSSSAGESIKIEPIRTLQEHVYLPPQLSPRRVIYFEGLDRLTVSATQALLKILEEPPPSVYFLAHAKHIHLILPTLLSRFQRWILPEAYQKTFSYLTQDGMEDWPNLVEGLLKLKRNLISVYALTEAWVKTPLLNLMDALYGVLAAMIQTHYVGEALTHTLVGDKQNGNLKELSGFFSLDHLFEMIQHTQDIITQLRSGLSIQPSINLENWLIHAAGEANHGQ